MSDELDDALQDLEAGGEVPVYLLVGEEFLVRQAAERLLKALVPGGTADLNLVTLDAGTPREVAAELATLPMFGGRKVVFCRDPEFLAPRKGRVDALGKAREAWAANRRKEAARRVLALAARAGWGVPELAVGRAGAPGADDWERELGVAVGALEAAFLAEVKAFCELEGLSAPSNDETALQDWLARGPSRGQVLVIATTELEAKGAFVKLVQGRGTLLQFKVAGRMKDLDLTGFAREVLEPHQKKLGAGALELLKDRVGGNFRLLQSELQKLALYSEGATITVKDVDLLVGHAREDEFFELSEALQKRNLEAALKFLADQLAQGSAPIMLLGSITSVVRTLLMSHERVVALTAGKPPRSYQDFQARVWPKIEAEPRGPKAKLPHPYGVFMGMQAALGYTRQALLRGLVSCAEADLALKLGGDALVLERIFWTLAGKAEPWASQMHVVRREKER